MLYAGCPHIFTGLEYSGASVRGHTYFPIVQCIGLQYSVLTIGGRREQERQRERVRAAIDWGMERERRREEPRGAGEPEG